MKRAPYTPPASSQVSSAELPLRLSMTDALHFPPVVYLAGDSSLLRPDVPRVAVIGTRRPTEEGRMRTRRLVRELVSRGVCIVSGLAEGVDTVAHESAIEFGGRTIAVVGLPLDRCYPPSNAGLQELIARDHLLMSQFSPDEPTHPSFFVQRNRTMALLAHATVIIEAGDSSGTLSQASETMRSGRPLFILRSALSREDLHWPQRFVARGASILDSSDQVLGVVA